MLRDRLARLKEGTEYLNYGRDIIVSMATDHLVTIEGPVRVLDVGFGHGADLLNIRQIDPEREVSLYGIDAYGPSVEDGAGKGIQASLLDVETERLPFDDQYFDIVVANQIIEHTKDIFWIFSEISRVVKPNGIVIVGVPNLAALHCRLLLLWGDQPSCIEMLGAHVRGITKDAFERFITADGYFAVQEVKGTNFYPFPPLMAKVLSRALPTLSVCLIIRIRRTPKPGTFIEVLETRFYETDYWKGEETSLVTRSDPTQEHA
jgi:ubiquinone/menaquinone biosynthesis C-methylase UbiE